MKNKYFGMKSIHQVEVYKYRKHCKISISNMKNSRDKHLKMFAAKKRLQL